MDAAPRDDVGPLKTRVVRMRLDELKLLPVNARFMRHETFQQLVRNLRADGVLTSVPFACRDDDGRYLVLSGNHRVQAALEAGITEAVVMVTDDPLPAARRIAIQLAHNALVGEDDPATLRALYERLDEVDLRLYSGLDDKTLELLAQVDVSGLSEANLSFQTVSFLFLPEERAEAEAAWTAARDLLKGARAVWLARSSEYEALLDALATTKAAYDIANNATALLLVLRIFEAHRTDLAAGWYDNVAEEVRHRKGVPLASIFGTEEVPAVVAAALKGAVDHLVATGEVKEGARWHALERWATAALAGT